MIDTTTLDRTLIKTLVEAWGPPGYEHQIRATIRDLVKDLADDIRVDASGSLICRFGSGGPKVMIAAHMDEIGLMINHIDRDGYARFSMIGTLLAPTLYGNRVRFENGTIGSFGLENSWHVTQIPKMTEFYIDFSTGAETFAALGVGDVATLWREYAERGNRLIAKSMDDRIGCAVAIETMRRVAVSSTPNELYFVFTTQEEVGIRGARTSAYGVAPDFGIALDVTPSGDMPKNEKMAVRLGDGAAIKVRDAGHIVPPAIKDLMIRRAKEVNIAYQLEVLDLGTTDAAAIQNTAAGVPSGAISIPCRYVHTTSETVDANDVLACINLLTELVTKPFEPES